MSISSAKQLISTKIYATTREVHWSQIEFCELFNQNAISIDFCAFKFEFDQISTEIQHPETNHPPAFSFFSKKAEYKR